MDMKPKTSTMSSRIATGLFRKNKNQTNNSTNAAYNNNNSQDVVTN